MPAPTQAGSLTKFSIGNAATTDRTITGVAAGAALTLWIAPQRFASGFTGELVSISCPTATFVRVGHHVGVSDNAGGGFRQELSLYLATNVAAGSHTVTVTAASIGGNTEQTQAAWQLSEFPGLTADAPASATSAPVVTGRVGFGVGTIALGPTANLSQAQSMVFAAFAAQTNFLWNGTDPGTPPSGFTTLGAVADNTAPTTAILAWQDVNSTAPISATMGIVGGAGNPDGTRGMIVALKLASGSRYVEILVQPDTEDGVTINGTTGWIVHVSADDPADGYTVYSGVAAQSAGNEIRVLGAGAGLAVGSTVNVQVVNAGLGYTSGWGVGTVRAAA